jgi:hypothetical protein
MLIAQQKKENNIAEYILYMWQLEDIIRANKLDIELVTGLLVEPLTVSEETKKEIADWYKILIDKMKKQGIVSKGHLNELDELIFELQYLHNTLLNVIKDKKYERIYLSAKLNIDAFKTKLNTTTQNEVDVCLNGLYGLLLLRLKKKPVSNDTTEAMNSFSQMIAYLSSKYKTASQSS